MEFQAVVMAAGPGSRMMDLTAKTPKALLPVANLPMVWYPLQMLERSGFSDAIVVVQESQRAEIQRTLEGLGDIKLHLDFVGIPGAQEWGTADTLRHIKDKIKFNTVYIRRMMHVQMDILVVSCDLITDLSLHLLADLHRTHDATLTILAAPGPELTEGSVAGGKANKNIEREFIAFDEKRSRMLFIGAEADLERCITFKKSFLKKHPFVDIETKLTDGHLYLMKRWIIDLLLQDTNITAIKAELVPDLVKKQFTQPQRISNIDLETTTPVETTVVQDIYSLAEESEYTKMAREYSTWNDHQGDMKECYHGDKIRCFAYVMNGGFCVRANTVLTYCEANRQVPRQLSALAPNKVLPLVHPSAKTPIRTVAPDSVVGEKTSLGEKVSIKRSVIGKHCTVGDKVKVTNCIIMDNVIIKEGSNLSGCVICDKADVGEKAELKDCIVGNSRTVLALCKFRNEILTELDPMMEIE